MKLITVFTKGLQEFFSTQKLSVGMFLTLTNYTEHSHLMDFFPLVHSQIMRGTALPEICMDNVELVTSVRLGSNPGVFINRSEFREGILFVERFPSRSDLGSIEGLDTSLWGYERDTKWS